MASYHGSLSSGGKQLTHQDLTTIDIFSGSNYTRNALKITYFEIEAFEVPFLFSVNGESTLHEVDENSSVTFENFDIDQIVIHGKGVPYRWTAMHIFK